MTTSWRCVLVGSESLLIQCAQTLEQRGHQVVAVVSQRVAIRKWAAERGIRLLRDAKALVAATDLQPFDWLFSITNLSVLPEAALALPTRGAINFHDGPLPEYAGLNTPVWALLNGEAAHGVTWHAMTAEVDAGGLYIQRRFDIAAGETALTLNTKCFEAGIDSFETMIDGLASGALQAVPQAEPLARYYGRKDRPAAAAALPWSQGAEACATLVRALDFGAYANPVASAKAAANGQGVIVREVAVAEAASTLAPGTVVAIDEAAITVSTSTHDLRLLRIEQTCGAALSAREAAVKLGLSVGARFDAVDGEAAARLTRINAAVATHEGFWQARLESRAPLELPQIDRSVAARGVKRGSDLVIGTKADAATLVAALVATLARLADKDAFDLGHADAHLRSLTDGCAPWFATQVPLRASIDFAQPFSRLSDALAAETAELHKRGSFANDLVARVPELRAQALAGDPRVLPVAVCVVETLADAHALARNELLVAFTADGTQSRWLHDEALLPAATVASLQASFATLLAAAVADGSRSVAELPLLDAPTRALVIDRWNATDAPSRAGVCLHRLIAEQAQRTPDRAAVICEDRQISYAELDRRSNQLARRLHALGVGPDVLVGLACERSVEMMVALVAIHKAGGAYVPLDPSYPKDRVAYMLEDSKAQVLLTNERALSDLPKHRGAVLCVDRDWPQIAKESAEPFDGGAEPQHVAYTIYTSGSTGKPKGVMVEHRNVVNFFEGMDRHLGSDEPGVWLAVTSLSFDISVLELVWTLTRGYSVVVATGEDRAAAAPVRGPNAHKPIDFSLFYFSSDESEGVTNKYHLLLEGAKYGDAHGFAAVWTPERHFHAFGGLYPNPSVTSAAIAAVTQRIGIRAGSVVLPLHHPARIAEEWSVVDNISNGRVGISFASGWQPNDFVLKPENFAKNKQVMLEGIETVRKLWRGEACSFPGATGNAVEVRILPKPVQKELPVWVTAAGNPETFAAAGRLGAHMLTHLLGQSIEELEGKLATYRKAWKDAGHAGEGYVSLMLHTFVGPDEQAVRAKVRQPLIEYLRSSVNLIQQYAWSFPAFKKREGMDTSAQAVDLQSLGKDEMDALLEHSFERYYEGSGLFGTPEQCAAIVDKLKGIGVDDVACLIDFGVDSASVLEHLPHLSEVRKLSLPPRAAAGDYTMPALMKRHAVTHLQCTPSMARMLVMDEAAAPGMKSLKRMMVGGEALPASLAKDLTKAIGGTLMNMYGPTETTIWSAVHAVQPDEPAIPLGRPLVNQQIYILDRRQQPLPAGTPGELVIAGAGVVRGYLHRPELTAERFLANPFRPGERMYRTGDLARQRADGTLEFLGRLDHQVKVRGYRIELGEIEAAILSHPSVLETVVVAREDTPGDTRIVAYVTAAQGQSPKAAELREHLKVGLPDFMLPSHFVTLAALPQTPNGKIDRKALPAPEADRAAVAQEAAAYVAPTGDLEETIASIWRDVLKLDEVGTRSNFFDLGGHSLLAVQTHRRLKEALQRELSITDIFRFPTIAGLSAYLSQAGADEGAAAKQGQDRAAGRRAAMANRRGARQAVSADRE
ncbi:MAG TPA: MupA/Atu3671 family FMN-dependent luciferase-like monooxygenase [Methylibium sp.]|uniref:MupA/Atu3671 family FMN-dependent luciferase-like monooxygenase n=1 Tax=Methylibium sp. TaxID=2067992 RepID=UPI002DB949CF|nr:MupA/Atu3671 family FMN-dependent luciferase-like monooxygenase [Methylibium sp.]HEU4459261.1 MupA/Atu3671 family FMN-dependent luciferase-like monooxygenase [Methylibium sp.]